MQTHLLKCNRCNDIIPDGAFYCITCGARIREAITGKTTRLHTEYQPTVNASGAPAYNPLVDYSNEPMYITHEELINITYSLSLDEINKIGKALRNEETIYLHGRKVIITD